MALIIYLAVNYQHLLLFYKSLYPRHHLHNCFTTPILTPASKSANTRSHREAKSSASRVTSRKKNPRKHSRHLSMKVLKSATLGQQLKLRKMELSHSTPATGANIKVDILQKAGPSRLDMPLQKNSIIWMCHRQGR